MSADTAHPSAAGAVVGFDHVALPMHATEAMIAFYRSLGVSVSENPSAVQVHFGEQMINFHRPEVWQGDFPLRAGAAVPPCGDLCIIWAGSPDDLTSTLDRAGVEIVEGPVDRVGARGVAASSVYVRDPDGNLLEFMRYGDKSKEYAHGS
jgi:catechol 2,3-dioxygenase-like lactoylglutathione lyase family enzyme